MTTAKSVNQSIIDLFTKLFHQLIKQAIVNSIGMFTGRVCDGLWVILAEYDGVVDHAMKFCAAS